MADVSGDRTGLVRRLEAWNAEYLGGVEGRDLVDKRVAEHFALVYVAGRLVARYDVLPYSQAEILAAVRYCHRHAHGEAETATPTSEPRASKGRILRAVAERVVQRRPDFVGTGREAPVSAAQVRAAPGFVHKGKNGTELLFPGQVPGAGVRRLRRAGGDRRAEGGGPAGDARGRGSRASRGSCPSRSAARA